MAPRAPAVSRSATDLSDRERELLSVTIEVLDAYGYDRLTVDEVAARARASKATIYRRWPSKAALIVAAVAARVDTAAFAKPMPDVALRGELLHVVRLLTAEALEMHVTLAGLIGEASRNEELRASIEEHFVTPRRDTMRALLERRKAAGEIREDVDLELVGPIASALVYQRLLITFEPVEDTLPDQIVDELLLPLLT